jgi:hypothetical protein
MSRDGVDIVVRAADIVVNKLGPNDIAFTLISSADWFGDLVAMRDELGLAGHVVGQQAARHRFHRRRERRLVDTASHPTQLPNGQLVHVATTSTWPSSAWPAPSSAGADYGTSHFVRSS